MVASPDADLAARQRDRRVGHDSIGELGGAGRAAEEGDRDAVRRAELVLCPRFRLAQRGDVGREGREPDLDGVHSGGIERIEREDGVDRGMGQRGAGIKLVPVLGHLPVREIADTATVVTGLKEFEIEIYGEDREQWPPRFFKFRDPDGVEIDVATPDRGWKF